MTLTFPHTFSSRADILFHLAELFGVCASVIDEATGALDRRFETEEEFSAFKGEVWGICFPGVEYQG